MTEWRFTDDSRTIAARIGEMGEESCLAAALHEGTVILDPTPTPAPVPAVVTRAQARIALSRAGKLDAVQAAIDGIGGETKIWWDDATEIHRNHPLVSDIAVAVGLSSDDVDALFRAAAIIGVNV